MQFKMKITFFSTLLNFTVQTAVNQWIEHNFIKSIMFKMFWFKFMFNKSQYTVNKVSI